MVRRKASFSDERESVEKIVEKEESKVDGELSKLRQLIFLGRKEYDIDIEGGTFKVTTMTSGQQRDMMKYVITLSEEERVPSMREAILSRAVLSANGVPLEELYDGPDADELTDFQKRSFIISEMQFSVISERPAKNKKKTNKKNVLQH